MPSEPNEALDAKAAELTDAEIAKMIELFPDDCKVGRVCRELLEARRRLAMASTFVLPGGRRVMRANDLWVIVPSYNVPPFDTLDAALAAAEEGP